MRQAVIDTSVLAALSGIGRIDVILAVFPDTHIVPAVYRETVTDGLGWLGARAAQSAIREGRFRRVESARSPVVPNLTHLGAGEREVIGWAVHRRIPALIDEAPARKAAESAGVSEIVGSLGLLGRAKALGIIAETASWVAQMRSNGIRFRDDLVEKFLATMNEQ